jgi:hypothetical protein
VADQVSGYLDELQAGRRVIVVAHSQGNLYANASHAAIAASDSTVLTSFGIVGVADPAEISFNGYVTSDDDLVINALRTLGETVLPANVHVPVTDDFTGHFFEATYINAQLPARARVVSLLASVAGGLPYPAGPNVTCAAPDASPDGAPDASADAAPDASADGTSDASADSAVMPSNCTFGMGGASSLFSGAVAPAKPQGYSLQATAGSGVVIRLLDVAHSAFAPAFDVYDPTGTIIINGANGRDIASAAFTATMSGTYNVTVYDVSGLTNVGGAYNLYWTVAPGADACGALTPGGDLANFLGEGALHSYTFEPQAGEGVILRVVGPGAGSMMPGLNVYDPAGASVVSDANGQDVTSTEFTTATTGTYTVVVYDVSSGYATGSYTVYFVLAPGADKDGSLTPGGEITGQLAEGALDSYTFTAQAGEGVFLRVVNASTGTLLPAVNVYDPSGAPVIVTSGQEVASTEFTTAKTGTYTVVVYDASNGAASTGPYNLYFTLAPGANNGGLLPPGGKITGQLAEGALDSYTFDAQAGQGVFLRLVNPGTNALLPALTIYDPGGAPVIVTSGQEGASAEFSAAKTGTYTVVVYDASNGSVSTGTYNLYFFIAPGAESGGSLDGGEASATLGVGALDSYTFVAAATDKVTVQVTATGGGSLVPALNVYDPTGASAIYAASGQVVASGTFNASIAGTYTIVVYDASPSNASTGPYSVAVTITSTP